MTTTITVPQRVRDLAAGAAAELRRRGWTRGNFFVYPDEKAAEAGDTSNCRVCVLGAINAASGTDLESYVKDGSDQDLLAWEIATRLVPDFTPSFDWDAPGYVANWNDQEVASVDDILTVLDAIAAGEPHTEAAK